MPPPVTDDIHRTPRPPNSSFLERDSNVAELVLAAGTGKRFALVWDLAECPWFGRLFSSGIGSLKG